MRVAVVAAIYLSAAFKFSVAAPLDLLVTSLLLVVTVVVTIASYWHTHIRGRAPTRTFLYSQALFDALVITAIVQGLLAGLAYAVLDVPFPVFLMALTIVLAPLPFGGTVLVWGPVALYLFWTGPLWKAIAMLVWGAGVVTMADNVLRPMLIGKKAKLPVLFLFFSILGGLAAYGVIGLFLGPILLAILLTAFQIYHEEYLTESASPPMTA